tara:strand:+ start:692 stop:1051 length:360 start_codon:yes stop_codon:yes gene_type:complete
MTISYNKTWEVMNGLEESFNRITTISQLAEDLVEAVDNDDRQSIIDLSHAINAYVPVYISQYDKASKRAWNNTVGEVRKIDNPYHVNDDDLILEDVKSQENEACFEALSRYNNLNLSQE